MNLRNRNLLVYSSGTLALLLLILWQTGAFTRGRIRPGLTVGALRPPAGASVTVQSAEVPVVYRAAGTIRSRSSVELSPRIVARVAAINVRSGDRVKKGDVLARLDDGELTAAVAQASEHVLQARATLALATTELGRTRTLLSSGNATQQAFDAADTAVRQAQAMAQAAAESKRQAEAVLGYATIISPMDGVVAERLVDPGDLASPGNILMRLFDPTRLMLEVPIREGLAARIKVGEKVPFRVEALDAAFTGDVREIVPAVDPGSRTFVAKVCIGETPALVPGMSGVLELPLGTRPALTVPETAVTRVGQLEYVAAVIDGSTRQVLVRTTPAGAGHREVVSGLAAGMTVLVAQP
jgi:HlyD family secretion protein